MRHLSILLFVLVGLATEAQSFEEALWFGERDLIGSPRYTALGGAMGALGNDFSSVHDNPAGLAVFRRGRLELDLGVGSREFTSAYYGEDVRERSASLFIAQAGLVAELEQLGSKDVRYFAGLSFKRLADFGRRFKVAGSNPVSSIIDQWIYNSNGIPSDQLIDQGWLYEGMAWEAYLTDVIDPTNFTYSSSATGLDLMQEREVRQSGGHDELLFSLAANRGHRLFYGAGIGIPFLEMTEESNYTESEFDANSSVNDLLLYDRYGLSAVGLNLHLGFQYRFNYWWRVGASWISPTVYAMNSNFETQLSANFRDGTSASSQEYYNDEIMYRLTTPQRFMCSSAFVIGKSGFISVEYRSAQMNWQRFHSRDFDLENIDKQATDELGWQHTLTLASEFRAGPVYLRGFHLWGNSPYSTDGRGMEAQRAFGFGTGFTFSKWRFDIAWRRQLSDRPYSLYSSEFTEAATLSDQSSMLVMGVFLSF